ncbi:hypothetical protein [Mucilaginibacter sp. FT3.2]|uniref:hypothetical protein n=1 Tax=Mucilaginibacter sp. FT3.2 TaxID=2723090 RepID=UPI00161D602A|nr:hypothetical protein [Mucilaginibacter sp. FT3.2]MBB6234209.1 pentatricopeptide repeat protein [Mucilaginibacter sp. FT3.2]
MKKLILLTIALKVAISAQAQVKIPVAEYLKLLDNNKYDVVYEDVQKIRVNKAHAKSPILDYFEAKCLCMNGSPKDAFKIYNKMLQSDQLSKEERNFLYKEFLNCGSHSAALAVLSTAAPKPLTLNIIPSSWHGKLGDVTNCYDYTQFIDFTSMPSADSLAQRVFDYQHKRDANKLWSNLLGNGYDINTASDRFVVVTPSGSNAKQILTVVEKIQHAANFYSTYYKLSAPTKLITVFMMPDINAMQALSKKLHGINLPVSNLGYSSINDLTLVTISNIEHIGTIYHELFHLMIRADIGDIPVWLDEGLACLYTTSSWDGDNLVGSYDTWRTRVLLDAANSRDNALRFPTINLLTSYTWDEFNGSDDHNICEASMNYAMSNHLMLYLQEKGLLIRIVSAFRNRTVIDLKKQGSYQGNAELLEEALGEPIDSLDKQFTRWMQDKYQLHLENNQVKSSVYSFNDLLHGHLFNLILLNEEHGMTPLKLAVFQKQQDDINYRYESISGSDEEHKFYKAEEDRLHGNYNPYVETDQYNEIKTLYDETLALEQSMRKALFQ